MSMRRRSMSRRSLGLGLLVGILALVANGTALAAPGWQPPVDLTAPDQWTTKGPDVGINEHGDLAVVWSERYDPYNTGVKAIIRPAGGAFSQPHEVSDPAGSDPNPRPFITTGQNTSPRVAVGPTGEAVAVWLRNGEVRAMAFPPGAPDGPRSWVWRSESNTDEEAHLMDLGMDAAGNASTIWAGNGHVQYAYRPAGGSFGARQTLANPGLYAHEPSLAVSRGGAVAAIWHDYENVYAAVRDAGQGFSATQTLEVPPRRGDAPDIAMDARGNAVAVWIDRVPTNVAEGEVKLSYRPAGGKFGEPRAIARVWYATPRVAMSPGGEAIVYWAGGTVGLANPPPITAISRSSAGVIGGFEPVSSDYYGLPRMVFDSGGDAYAAWQAILGEYDFATYASVRRSGASFSGQADRLSPGASWGPPALAAGAPGKAVAVWPERVGNEVGLQLAEYGEASGKQPALAGTRSDAVGVVASGSGPAVVSTATSLQSLSLRRVQRGTVVRGTARVRGAGCALEATLHHAGTRVGAFHKRRLASGPFHFSIRLVRAARASLRTMRSMKLKVRVVVTCTGTRRAVATRAVKLRPR